MSARLSVNSSVKTEPAPRVRPARRVFILGMGSPILGDDGVGLAVAERLKGRIAGADVASSVMVGLGLIDEIVGYDVIYVVDAMTTRSGTPGELKKIAAVGGAGTLHLFSSHGMNLFELIELGTHLGYAMPAIGAVYGIEIGDEVTFDEELSPAITYRLDAIIEDILADMLATAPSVALIAQAPDEVETIRRV